jgi:AraC-like DNA-binding protein
MLMPVDSDLRKASRLLSDVPLVCEIGNVTITVMWFRVMQKSGEWLVTRHSHSCFEFHFIADGECILETDDATATVPSGTCFLCAPGVFHQQRSLVGGSDTVEYSLACKFHSNRSSGTVLDDEGNALISFFTSAPCKPFKDDSVIIPLFQQAMHAVLERKSMYAFELQSIVISLLVAAARLMGMPEEGRGGATGDNRMETITQFVNDNLHKQITPSDIANFMNLSEKQISRILILNDGQCTKKFITQQKINEARRLLEETTLSVSDISSSLCFSTDSYFVNVFRQAVGSTPGIYRMHFQQNTKMSKN